MLLSPEGHPLKNSEMKLQNITEIATRSSASAEEQCQQDLFGILDELKCLSVTDKDLGLAALCNVLAIIAPAGNFIQGQRTVNTIAPPPLQVPEETNFGVRFSVICGRVRPSFAQA